MFFSVFFPECFGFGITLHIKEGLERGRSNCYPDQFLPPWVGQPSDASPGTVQLDMRKLLSRSGTTCVTLTLGYNLLFVIALVHHAAYIHTCAFQWILYASVECESNRHT